MDRLSETPKVIEIDAGRFVLTDGPDGPELYSAVCPHQRGRVRVADERTLLCPNHRWTFDPETGRCTSGADAALTEIPLTERDGTLYADLSSIEE